MNNTVVTSKPRNLIFISHATPDDNDFTSWLSARLASDGYEVWSDLTQLVGGEVFWKDIDDAIRHYSIKFLSVLSPVSVGKRGFKKELSVADAVEAKGMLGDFIIPLRIGGIPYDDIPIDIHNKNVIDFTKGWHIGLAQLLEKLEKDHVPRKDNVEFALSSWAKGFLEIDKLLENNEEEVISNWLPIFEMPSSIKISYFDSVPPNIDFLKRQWPCRQIENSVISFADAKDFNTLDAPSALKNLVAIETSTFLHNGHRSFTQLSFQDRSNILTDLLRQSWERYAQQQGMQGFALANNKLCWYVSKSHPKIERTKFVDALGNSGSRALLGKSEKLKAFWHFALEIVPSVGKVNRFTLLPHVIFTSDGVTPIGDPAQMHRLRRRFCKSWWQDRWRDLASAYLAELAKGQDSLLMPVSPNRNLEVRKFPITYMVPVKTLEKIADNSVIEDIEDVDLLYDDKEEDSYFDQLEEEELQ